jgi:hypothetical protein
MKNTHFLFFVILVFVSVLGLSKPCLVNAEAQFNVEQAISAGNHQALSKYYRSQAEAQKALAETHDKMRISYQNSPSHYNSADAHMMAGHCEDLRVQALKMAELYNNLAIQEERLEAIK